MFRKFHQNNITFSMLYAFTENFVLPVSHDEVVHGKGHLLSEDARAMSGSASPTLARFWRYMFAHPGKKLMFMGCEIGQTWEWNHDQSLPWMPAGVPGPSQLADAGSGAQRAVPPGARPA